MKMLTPFVVGVLVVILGYALWVGLIEVSFTKGTVPDQDGQGQQEGPNNAAGQGSKGSKVIVAVIAIAPIGRAGQARGPDRTYSCRSGHA